MHLEMAAALEERHRRTGDEGRNLASGTPGHCPAIHTEDSAPAGNSEGAAGRATWGGESSGRDWVALAGPEAAVGFGGPCWSPPSGVPEVSWLSPAASRSGPLLSEKGGKWLLPPVLDGGWPFSGARAEGPSNWQKMGQWDVTGFASSGGSEEMEALSEWRSPRRCCSWRARLLCSAPTENSGCSLGWGG